VIRIQYRDTKENWIYIEGYSSFNGFGARVSNKVFRSNFWVLKGLD